MGSQFSHSGSNFDMEAETKIARFYEAHPMYYDLSHVDHKNRAKKDAVLKKFADTLGTGWTREYIS